MEAKASKGEIGSKVIREFEVATAKQKGGFKALPEKVKKRSRCVICFCVKESLGVRPAQGIPLWG